MAPNSIPVDRVRIFGRDGYPLIEFRTRVERSYAIADEARAQFTYATRKTEIVNKVALNFGNWLLVENDSLPPWVGVIDTPRSWNPRSVTVSAYSPEKVFSWRRGPTEVVRRGSAGDIFSYLLTLVNSAERTIITEGDIDRSGIRREETINPTPLNEDLARIQERSQEEYQWRPIVGADGKLRVFVDWMNRVGQTTSALLQEGKGGGNVEMVDALFVEDGEIRNDILGYGDGITWKSRPKIPIVDADSIGEFGLRESSEFFQGVTNVPTLKANTRDAIAKFKNPVRNMKLRAINLGDTFKFINLGNIMALSLQSMGFQTGGVGYETNVRIMGMAYNPGSKNKIDLIVEVID